MQNDELKDKARTWYAIIAIGLLILQYCTMLFKQYDYEKRLWLLEVGYKSLERMYYDALIVKPETCPVMGPFPKVCITRDNNPKPNAE